MRSNRKRLEDYGWSFRWLWVVFVVYFAMGTALGLALALGPPRAQITGVVGAVLWFAFMGLIFLPKGQDEH